MMMRLMKAALMEREIMGAARRGVNTSLLMLLADTMPPDITFRLMLRHRDERRIAAADFAPMAGDILGENASPASQRPSGRAN